MDISILIPTYKRVQLLTTTLQSMSLLDTEGLSWEVLLIDNAGDEATKVLIEKFSKRLPISYLVEKKQGKNNALNIAILRAQGGLFIFADDDVITDKYWLRELWDGSNRWPDHDIFGGKILPKWPLKDHPFPDIDKKILIGTYGIADWNLGEGPCQVEKVYGSNMAIRKKIFQKSWKFNGEIGPCGENYIMGSETELLSRLEKAGFKAVYLPKAIVYHQIRKEQLGVKWLCQRAFKRGCARVYHENYPKVAMLFNMPRYLIKRIAKLFIERAFSIFAFDKSKRLNIVLKYWFIKGMIYQYRFRRT